MSVFLDTTILKSGVRHVYQLVIALMRNSLGHVWRWGWLAVTVILRVLLKYSDYPQMIIFCNELGYLCPFVSLQFLNFLAGDIFGICQLFYLVLGKSTYACQAECEEEYNYLTETDSILYFWWCHLSLSSPPLSKFYFLGGDVCGLFSFHEFFEHQEAFQLYILYATNCFLYAYLYVELNLIEWSNLSFVFVV